MNKNHQHSNDRSEVEHFQFFWNAFVSVSASVSAN